METNGGRYEHDLRPDSCTHLVAERPEGDKYMLVRHSSSVRVMRKEWVYACAKENRMRNNAFKESCKTE